MKGKVKKLVALVLLGMLVSGGAMTAQAASLSTQAVHVHHSQETFAGTIRSVNATHEYATAINYDHNGNVVGYRYGTCIVTTNLNSYNYVCWECSTVTGSATKTIVTHSVAH